MSSPPEPARGGPFWPGGAQLAVTVSMQFEAGGQPVSGASGPITEPVLDGFPDLGQNSFYEYGAVEGVPRLLDLSDKHDIKITSFMIGDAVRRHPGVAAAIVDRGHEAGAHGRRWARQYTINGAPFATVPYTVHLNDIASFDFPGFSPAAYEQQLLDEFDQLYAEGAARRRLMVIRLRERISGRPSRVRVLDRVLTRLRQQRGVWWARKDEVARYALDHPDQMTWVDRAPAPLSGLPGRSA